MLGWFNKKLTLSPLKSNFTKPTLVKRTPWCALGSVPREGKTVRWKDTGWSVSWSQSRPGWRWAAGIPTVRLPWNSRWTDRRRSSWTPSSSCSRTSRDVRIPGENGPANDETIRRSGNTVRSRTHSHSPTTGPEISVRWRIDKKTGDGGIGRRVSGRSARDGTESVRNGKSFCDNVGRCLRRSARLRRCGCGRISNGNKAFTTSARSFPVESSPYQRRRTAITFRDSRFGFLFHERDGGAPWSTIRS